jgi:hypothetical protein
MSWPKDHLCHYSVLSEQVGAAAMLLTCIRENLVSNLGMDIEYAATCFHAGFLLGLFFDPEDGGYMFLRNVG